MLEVFFFKIGIRSAIRVAFPNEPRNIMANQTLFQTIRGAFVPPADSTNLAGGTAYRFSDEHALAQLASTGCLNGTFYASAADQLDSVLALAMKVDVRFVAQTAVYARREGFMKDMPALLCAVLAARDTALLEAVFPDVIDNGKMLRTFVQILRSGVVGRKSLGSAPKRLVRRWLERASDDQLFRASVGNSPSLADVIKMVHPRPGSARREALYGYLIGRPYDVEKLPALVLDFERYKRDRNGAVPNVPFQMLTALDLDTEAWTEIARNAPWQMTRMNLNTFARHGVFEVNGLPDLIARRLADETLVSHARAFPYQLLAAFQNVGDAVPARVRDALQDAMEIATSNVPSFRSKVAVCVDASGSMHSPVTGYRSGASSKVRCVDAAALVAATLLRRNRDTIVLPFTESVINVRLNQRDSIMTNAKRLASLPAGGTNCSAPLKKLAADRTKLDLVIMVSDNESWIDSPTHGRWGGGSRTATLEAWTEIKRRNPQAKLVCIDITPNETSQVPSSRPDILNIGGFSDRVFDVIAAFAKQSPDPDFWVREIKRNTIINETEMKIAS